MVGGVSDGGGIEEGDWVVNGVAGVAGVVRGGSIGGNVERGWMVVEAVDCACERGIDKNAGNEGVKIHRCGVVLFFFS